MEEELYEDFNSQLELDGVFDEPLPEPDSSRNQKKAPDPEPLPEDGIREAIHARQTAKDIQEKEVLRILKLPTKEISGAESKRHDNAVKAEDECHEKILGNIEKIEDQDLKNGLREQENRAHEEAVTQEKKLHKKTIPAGKDRGMSIYELTRLYSINPGVDLSINITADILDVLFGWNIGTISKKYAIHPTKDFLNDRHIGMRNGSTFVMKKVIGNPLDRLRKKLLSKFLSEKVENVENNNLSNMLPGQNVKVTDDPEIRRQVAGRLASAQHDPDLQVPSPLGLRYSILSPSFDDDSYTPIDEQQSITTKQLSAGKVPRPSRRSDLSL